MMKRRFLAVKAPCGEEVYLPEGHSATMTVELHKKNCILCNPPPPPPKLIRQTAVMIEDTQREADIKYNVMY
jgi:hypothetical protein